MKIVAIGGGNFSLDDKEKPYNLGIINKQIVKLSNKNHPRLLYIGFTVRADYYFSYIKKIFASLGCQCEYLRFSEFDNKKAVESKFKRADIIFLPGGDTHTYMKMVIDFNIDKYLIDSANRDVVMAGISAGAMMIFEGGPSSALKETNDENFEYSKANGLGICSGIIAPHFSQSARPTYLRNNLKNVYGEEIFCFGIDECSALVVDGENVSVINSQPDAKVFRCCIKNGEYLQKELKDNISIEELYKI